MVLVGDAVLRFIDPGHNADRRKSDVETLSQFDQWPVRIPDAPLHEKYGHMEICPRLLWPTLVEVRIMDVCSIGFDSYSVLPQYGRSDRDRCHDSGDRPVCNPGGVNHSNGACLKKDI